MSISSLKKKIVPIKYTSRDRASIKEELDEYRRKYYSNISRDENQASFDDMMLDTVAYVGDILSFYLDYSVNESFIDTSVEYNNILRHGKSLGYKFRGNPSSFGIQTFYIIVPSSATGLGPDPDYIPILKKGTTVSSQGGASYILNEDINFADSNNKIVVARVDEETGAPTAYAIRAYGQVISGELVSEIISVGAFSKFLRLSLSNTDIAEILSVIDSEGHEYFEVDNLVQDVVFKEIPNTDLTTNIDAPNLLKPISVPRRFIVERDRTTTYLQFGFGSEDNVSSEALNDPSKTILNVYGKEYFSDSSIDPTNLLGTDKLGIAPANTSLTISYRINTTDNVNASANSVINVVNPEFEFPNINSINIEQVRLVTDSLETVNDKAIIGDITVPTIDELKRRIFGTFSAQERAVTTEDYKAIIYNMHPKFGAIKRAGVFVDRQAFKRNINIFLMSEDANGHFVVPNNIIRRNLKTWLLRYKSINDTIDLIDGKILNIGIRAEIIAVNDQNKFDIRTNAIQRLQDFYQKKFDFGEPFSIANIYQLLGKVEGVVDVLNVEIFKQNGAAYSDLNFNIKNNLSADKKYLIVPKNVVCEIKYLESDISVAIK